jgi:hypothetical protein
MSKALNALRLARMVIEQGGHMGTCVCANGPPIADVIEGAITKLEQDETPVRERRIFQNKVRVFHSIDRHELNDAGYDIGDVDWSRFKAAPLQFFIICDEDKANAIWSVVKERTAT